MKEVQYFIRSFILTFKLKLINILKSVIFPSSMQTVLQIEDGRYPFDQNIPTNYSVQVQDIQSFHSSKDLLHKKSEMQKKTKLINSPHIIKLLKIYQEDCSLHYIYEYVPQSLASYFSSQIKKQHQEGAIMKKVSHELMILISYLVEMRIEVELCVQNLGFTNDQRLKLFMNSRCKMGHKTQLSLITYYGHCKQTIVAFIESETLRRTSLSSDKNNPNFSIKGNKLIFDQVPLNFSVYQNNTSFQSENQNQTFISTANQNHIFSSNAPSKCFNERKSTASCINHDVNEPEFLRQTQNPQFGRNWRYSQSKNRYKSNQKQKYHKDSFQFGANKQKQTKFHTLQDETRSFSHSKSIRIELEQMKGRDKRRKDSYKVKITSMHQYDMDDCNPNDLFGNNNGSTDLFQNLLKKAKSFSKHGEQKQKPKPEDYEAPSPKKFMRKESTPQYSQTADMSDSTHRLQEKVKRAKEKAEIVLNKYMRLKKAFSYNQ